MAKAKKIKRVTVKRPAKFLGSSMSPIIQFAVAFIFIAALVLVAYAARYFSPGP